MPSVPDTGSHVWIQAMVVLLVAAAGCTSTFNPTPMDQVPFMERAETSSTDNVRITVAVLSADEAKAVFDKKLYKKGIQPIWMEIENRTEGPMLFLPSSQ